jgi:fibronectin type 3 domain-containing protein
MASPGIPTNFIIQQGNSQVFLSWDIMAGATSYPVYRSTDGVSYSLLSSPVVNSLLDSTVTVNTKYYYKVQSSNGELSSFTSAQSIIPTQTGKMSLSELRLSAQQRADRVNSNFVSVPEWNSYINQAAFELYDLLVTCYEDYYIASPYQFQTDGSQSYDLSTRIPLFYKLAGVDCGISSSNNAWVTLKKFDFIARNRYVYPNLNATVVGLTNLQYRIMGSKLMFIPTPSSGQYLQIWYIPRMTQLLQDTDVLDGVDGWTEYVIVRAAKYILDKEESDTSKLDAELLFLKSRIEETAMNRDVGQPDTISNTREIGSGIYGAPNGDGPFGGY